MRFLCDMCISMRVAEWLRARGHDAVHLRERGMHRSRNGEIFALARREGRIVLAFDLGFGEIVAASGGTCPSVLVFRLRNTRSPNVIARLARVLADSADVLEAGAVIAVEEGRHRVRELPIGPAMGRQDG